MDLYCVLISFVELCNLLFSKNIIAGVDPTDQEKDKIDLLYKSQLTFRHDTYMLDIVKERNFISTCAFIPILLFILFHCIYVMIMLK